MSSSESKIFDILVLGSGEAGKYIAWTLSSKASKRCAVIERRWLGGSCPNFACLPSKNFVHSANVAHSTSQGSTYGLPFMLGDEGGSFVKMEAVRDRKRDMVKGLVDMHASRFEAFGVELIWGEGSSQGPRQSRSQAQTVGEEQSQETK
jgi:pyruvate/2-oxoglutarate dehydrogenase complex dihydrolipoamide dehydrogenase (E3) component